MATNRNQYRFTRHPGYQGRRLSVVCGQAEIEKLAILAYNRITSVTKTPQALIREVKVLRMTRTIRVQNE